LVGPGDPAHAQVPESSLDDVGVVPEAPPGRAPALPRDARQEPHPVRLGLPGALDAALPRRGTGARPRPRGTRRLALRQCRGVLLQGLETRARTRSFRGRGAEGATMNLPPDIRPIDADNHYYEPLDAFTRHLDKAFNRRGVRPVQVGK